MRGCNLTELICISTRFLGTSMGELFANIVAISTSSAVAHAARSSSIAI